jgi:hypothetical protein
MANQGGIPSISCAPCAPNRTLKSSSPQRGLDTKLEFEEAAAFEYQPFLQTCLYSSLGRSLTAQLLSTDKHSPKLSLVYVSSPPFRVTLAVTCRLSSWDSDHSISFAIKLLCHFVALSGHRTASSQYAMLEITLQSITIHSNRLYPHCSSYHDDNHDLPRPI